MTAWPHVTVLRDEVVAALAPVHGEVHVDCTLGMGGHSEALLEAADCRVIGIDRDDEALAISRERLAPFGDRFVATKGSFDDFDEILDNLGVQGVHGVVADLGVSSLQLDTPDRGFSFRASGPLDMRMDASAPSTAAEIVNEWDEGRLSDLISRFGEERHARKIARTIVRGRPWGDTETLASAIADTVPVRGPQRIHPATRTFQALRIQVNDELGQLERLLPAVASRLLPLGRLAVISFHSLEDRIVKRFLAQESGRGTDRDPFGRPLIPPRLSARPKPILPSESDPNPRARSARLRTAVRLP